MDPNLRSLTFQACCAAIWSDGRMTPEEHRHLGHLVESLAEDEAEREQFRRMALEGWAVDLLFVQVRALPEPHRLFVFEKCVEVLGNDAHLGWRDKRFLRHLARACGMGYWAYRLKLRDLAGHRGLRHIGWKVPLLAAGILLVGAWLVAGYARGAGLVHPEPEPSGQDFEAAAWVPGGGPPAPGLGAEDLYLRAAGSFVTVKVLQDGRLRASGSGSVIGRDSAGGAYVLTNKHVVDQEHPRRASVTFEVQLASEARYDATLDSLSATEDLALLRVQGLGPEAAPLPLCRREHLQVGQPVYVLGSPHALKHTFTTGIISALRERYLQTDATISSGSSGGPVLQQQGALCGVTTRSHQAKNFSFALYADAVLDFLEARRKGLKGQG